MKETLELKGKIFDASALLQDRFGVNVNTICRWVSRGLLPAPVRLGRRHYFQRDLVEDLLSRGE